MIKYLFTIYFLSLSILQVSAQRLMEEPKYKNHIEIKPLNLLAGQYNINYERVLSPRISVEAGFGQWFSVENGEDDLTGNNFSINPRYYFSRFGYAPVKAYTGIYLNYNNLSVAEGGGNTNQSLNVFERGVLVGQQNVLKNGIVIDYNAGIAYIGDNYEGDNDDYKRKFLPKVGFTVGYSF